MTVGKAVKKKKVMIGGIAVSVPLVWFAGLIGVGLAVALLTGLGFRKKIKKALK